MERIDKSTKSTSFDNTYIFKIVLREMASHPSQPSFTTYMFWIEPLEKIVAKEWQVNHFNSICDTYILKNWTSQESILASHPSQPLFTTHIFSKIESLKEHFFKTRQVTQVNHSLRHTYFRKLNIERKFLARIGSHPSQPAIATYIFWKIKYFSN